MQALFENHLQKNFPFLKGKKILIAVSGGIDSMVLVHLLANAKQKFSIAHCNFNLRGKESDLDEQFVKDSAKKLNASFFIESFKTEKIASKNKISIQMAARDLRYAWFEKLQLEQGIDYVLTAHHKDDVLETFLINFTRGTGLEGLTGIPAVNNSIVRPLLPFSREEIEEFATKNKIAWREDQSNASTKYLRNKIRHDIVPILKELNPSFFKSFDKTLQNLNESLTLVEDRIESLKKHVISFENEKLLKISTTKILELKNPKAHLYELLKPYGFTAWEDAISLLTAQPGKQLFSKTHRLIKDRNFLLLTDLHTAPETHYFVLENQNFSENTISLNFETTKKMGRFNSQTAFIDKSLLKYPLVVRKREKGDYFYPIGMQGKKKLSKYFKDEKLSLLEKENTWLLCNGQEIVWVIGKRLDNRYKTHAETTEILKITYAENS